MVGLFILGIIGLIIYNIIDTMPLIINVRCILAYVFGLCALRAMGAYTDRERVCQVKCVSFFRYHKRRCVTSDCWL